MFNSRFHRKNKCYLLFVHLSFAELLVEFAAPNDLEIQNAILAQLSTYCKRPVTSHITDEFEDPFQWTFYHAIFFAFTVCSTLGELSYCLQHSTCNAYANCILIQRLRKYDAIDHIQPIFYDRLCNGGNANEYYFVLIFGRVLRQTGAYYSIIRSKSD